MAQPVDRGRVVVGVDGTASSARALDWAAEEAALRGSRLDIVHVEFARRELLVNFDRLERAETQVLEAAAQRARRREPGLDITLVFDQPPAAPALLRASAGADLLVLGRRGVSTLRGLSSDSVSAECARRAHCPVAIVGPSAASGSAPPGN